MNTHEIFEWGVSALVLSSFWVLFVLLVRTPVCRWLGARWAYYLWVLPLVGLLAVFSPAQSAKLQFGIPDLAIPWANVVIDGAVSAVADLNAANTLVPVQSDAGSSLTAEQALLILWLLGAVVSLVLLAVRSIKFSQWLRRASRVLSPAEQTHFQAVSENPSTWKAVAVRITACDSGPAVVGLVRPALLLPNDFFSRYSRQQQTLILQHEHHHLRRHDLKWLSLARLYRFIFWFSPLSYLAEHFLQLDQELSCDEKVLAGQNGAARRIYGEMLLLSAITPAKIPHARYAPTFSQVKERTRMLKHHHHRAFRKLIGAVVVATSILGSAAYGVGQTPASDSGAAMSSEVYEYLTTVQKSIEVEGADEATYAAAVENLNQFEARDREIPLTPYELAQVTNLAGYINYLKGDYAQAIVHYERISNLNHETLALQRATLTTMAQLQFVLEDYPQVLATAERLEKAFGGVPPSVVWLLKGQAHFQLQQYEPALRYINLLIEKTESEGEAPKENWLRLRSAAERELSGDPSDPNVGPVEGDMLPLVKVSPIYPQEALSQQIEGFCVVEYTVTSQGTVSDPRVVDSQCTDSVFHETSLQAAARFKYKPRVVDGTPVDVPGVRNRFHYQMSK